MTDAAFIDRLRALAGEDAVSVRHADRVERAADRWARTRLAAAAGEVPKALPDAVVRPADVRTVGGRTAYTSYYRGDRLGSFDAQRLTGARFAAHLPHAHLDEQAIPLRHGEVILMVDVPETKVHEVERLVSRRHPEVGVGGVGWHIHGLNA